ncbi:MAG: conjugal transfer protein TraX [Lachnospiraceae bacterium]|nr:conjugal transfer protein TraX [Lachnospiraceae bacterium]
MKDRIENFGISGSTLKLIAIITMLIDHTGATVIRSITRLPAVTGDAMLRSTWVNIYNISRDIGRIAFPIFCFLLVEGFLHTRSPRKYAGRLFLFALISEIPYDIALKGSWYYPDKQNVYFTLLIGLLVMIAIRWITDNGTRRLLLSAVPIALGMLLAWRMKTDYDYKGVFLIAVLYLMRDTRLYQCIGGAAAISWELPAPIAFIPVYFYNGKRGLSLKYVFYWFYPAHLMLLYVINTWGVPLLNHLIFAAQ